jgi:parvulin-like peptidyl-prolyl isomerase
MRWGFPGLYLLISVILFQSASAKPSDIAALVNKDTVTVQVLEAKLKGQTQAADPKLAISQTLNTLIIDKLVAQKAARFDFSQDSLFLKDKDDHLNKFVLGRMYEKYVAGLVSVTPEEAEKHYNENKETTYKIAEQVKVSHILIEPEEDTVIHNSVKRKKEADRVALQKAKLIKQKAAKEDFETLARTFSKDYITARQGGEMGYKKQGELLPEIDSAVFAAKPGDIIGPFQSQYGYHVIKVFEHVQEGYHLWSDSLQQKIISQLKAERTSQRNQAFLDSLRNQVNYDFNDQVLSLPETTKVKDSDWCVVIDKTDTLRAREIWNELLNFSLYSKAGQMAPDNKKSFLQKKSIWVQLKILQLVARQLGYYDTQEVKQEMKKFVREQAEKKIRQEATPPYNPSPEEIQRYFDSHPDQFKVEFPLHVYHIIFDDSLTAATVRDSILQGADFVEMAKKHYPGQTEIKEVAYDLGYISKYEMPEGFYEAADKLEIGEVSPPFKTFLGYHLIKLLDRKKDQTLQEVSPQIIKTLKEEQQKKAEAAWEAGLKKGAKIKIFQQNLDKIDLTQLNSEPNPASSDKH